MINLAILSPNQNAYSETFIQSHRKMHFEIKYYYGGSLPYALEPNGILPQNFRPKKGLGFYEQMLRTSLMKNKINCVLAEFGPTAAECLKVVKSLKLPMVVHFHGYDISIYDIVDKYREMYKEVFDYAQSVIAVSREMKDELVSLGCPIEKITLIYYGADPSYFNVTPSYNSDNFVCVGRFVDKKAPYLSLLAFKNLLTLYPNSRLSFVGDGPLYNTVLNLSKALNINEKVDFCGVLSTKDIQILFKNSICYIQHSIQAINGDKEGTPVSIMEASASGLPVVSTLHAGIPDVIIHGETGYLVDQLDVDSMSKYLHKVVKDKKHARYLGENAKERIRSSFNQNYYLKEIEDIILKSVKSHAG
jgi:colanic acid/amylovoran biosynthesis glycosyltransferase